MLHLNRFGVIPLSWEGLVGIIASPLLHGDLKHLMSNSIPLLALGAGLYYFYPKIATRVVIIAWISSGIALWIIGRPSIHIGASGLVYALAGFIFLSGLLRKQPNLLALSLLVIFLYGGLFWGLLPVEEKISWEAHLTGLSSGFALAINYRHLRPRQKKYSWDLEEETSEFEETEELFLQDEAIQNKPQIEAWKQYSNNHLTIVYHYNPEVTKQPNETNNTQK